MTFERLSRGHSRPRRSGPDSRARASTACASAPPTASPAANPVAVSVPRPNLDLPVSSWAQPPLRSGCSTCARSAVTPDGSWPKHCTRQRARTRKNTCGSPERTDLARPRTPGIPGLPPTPGADQPRVLQATGDRPVPLRRSPTRPPPSSTTPHKPTPSSWNAAGTATAPPPAHPRPRRARDHSPGRHPHLLRAG
jgi:hypothetical protein